jgi:hypothetical protein
MGLFRALANTINREYDRRIKRASLIKEYGMAHHDQAADHADEAHASDAHAAEEEAEIVNIPRGTPVTAPAPQPSEPAETHD